MNVKNFPTVIYGRENSSGDRQYYETQSKHLPEIAYFKENVVVEIVYILSGAIEAGTGEKIRDIFSGEEWGGIVDIIESLNRKKEQQLAVAQQAKGV